MIANLANSIFIEKYYSQNSHREHAIWSRPGGLPLIGLLIGENNSAPTLEWYLLQSPLETDHLTISQ